MEHDLPKLPLLVIIITLSLSRLFGRRFSFARRLKCSSLKMIGIDQLETWRLMLSLYYELYFLGQTNIPTFPSCDELSIDKHKTLRTAKLIWPAGNDVRLLEYDD